jgi:NADPH:quinone reductase-like Zn-dependent oxidoreductase
MKAIRCKVHGPPSKLVLEDIQDVRPKVNEVLVSVKAWLLEIFLTPFCDFGLQI